MKERPILFSAPMVRALLDGSKTQTRRVVKPKPSFFGSMTNPTQPFKTLDAGLHCPILCPYGQPGDRLWVREAFDFIPAGGPDTPQSCEIVYWATGGHETRCAPIDYNPMIYGHEKVRPSIHMPRWASRITLEVTGVRVERLQDISRGDAMGEGCPFPNMAQGDDPRQWYADLWRQINGPDSWDLNPWVWVVEFKKVTA